MPSRKYAFEQGGPKRVEVSWRGMWKNITVKVDGYVLGTIANKKELQEGRHFTLSDGSVLSVQLLKSFSSVQLHVARNGRPLPGSDSDPAKRLSVAYGIIFFIAGLNLVLGVLAVLADVPFLAAIGIDWTTIVFGVVFLLLGFLVKGRSMVALAIAVALFILSGIWAFYVMMQLNRTPPVGGIIVRILFLVSMIQGFGAIRDLEASEQQRRPW